MQMQRESGRNASNLGWHVLRISRSINHGRVVLAYISRAGVSESIRNLCLKREGRLEPLNISPFGNCYCLLIFHQKVQERSINST
jgi:hypothetical protein